MLQLILKFTIYNELERFGYLSVKELLISKKIIIKEDMDELTMREVMAT